MCPGEGCNNRTIEIWTGLCPGTAYNVQHCLPILPSWHHGCWCPGNGRSQGTVHEKLSWFIWHLSDRLYIFYSHFLKSLTRHLGLAIGNVRCVRWFSWTLQGISKHAINYGKPEWFGPCMLTLNEGSYLGLTRSISWLLMPWLLTSPGHQQPWYWLCKISKSCSYTRKDFNYLWYVSMEEWHKM